MSKAYSFFQTRRKRYLIDPNFQIKIIILFLFLSFSILTIIYLFDTYYFEYFIQKGKDIDLEKGHVYYRLLQEQKKKMDTVFLYLSITLTIFVLIFGVFLSHKIAGPLYRLRIFFKEKEYEDGIPLVFRKGDFFQDIPKIVNQSLRK